MISRAVDELALRLADETEQAIEAVVVLRGPALATSAEVEQLLHPELDREALARYLTRRRAKAAAGAGAVTSVPGVVPGFGTAAQLVTSVVDSAALIYSEVALILELAHVFGRDLRQHDERRLDLLVVLARDAKVRLPDELVRRARAGDVNGPVPREAVGELNRQIGTRVVRRVAERRARVLLGRELPLGVGMAIGAGTNYRAMSGVGRTALRFYTGR
jgi:hypothetical protein